MSLKEVCIDLELTNIQCRKLESLIEKICAGKKPKRKRSLWQQCIAERRKRKPFDPQAIKELAKEYRAGRCP